MLSAVERLKTGAHVASVVVKAAVTTPKRLRNPWATDLQAVLASAVVGSGEVSIAVRHSAADVEEDSVTEAAASEVAVAEDSKTDRLTVLLLDLDLAVQVAVDGVVTAEVQTNAQGTMPTSSHCHPEAAAEEEEATETGIATRMSAMSGEIVTVTATAAGRNGRTKVAAAMTTRGLDDDIESYTALRASW
jgi:hypothetical protein